MAGAVCVGVSSGLNDLGLPPVAVNWATGKVAESGAKTGAAASAVGPQSLTGFAVVETGASIRFGHSVSIISSVDRDSSHLVSSLSFLYVLCLLPTVYLGRIIHLFGESEDWV